MKSAAQATEELYIEAWRFTEDIQVQRFTRVKISYDTYLVKAQFQI